MSNIPSILLSLAGFSIFSAGVVLTKAGGGWLKWHGKKDRSYLKSLLIWLAGVLLYNVAVIPNAIASKTLPPHIISAISGFGITVMVILSYFLLKEKLFATDFIFSFIMVAGIFTLSVIDRPAASATINQTAFYIMLVLPFLLLLPLLLKSPGNKPRAVLLSIFSGSTGGFSLVVMNVVIKSLGYNIFSYFDTPFPYLYLLSGLVSFVALQLAMRKGEMILVGPLQTSLMILYPVACSYFIFGSSLSLIQLAIIAVIIYACIAILRKH